MSHSYPSRNRPAVSLAAIAIAMITWLSGVLPAHATFPGLNGEIVVQTKRFAIGLNGSSSTIYFLDPDTGNQVLTPRLEGPDVRVPWHSHFGPLRFEPDGLRYVGLLNDGDGANGADGYAVQSVFEQHVRQTVNPGNGASYASPMLDGRIVFIREGAVAAVTPETGVVEVIASTPTASIAHVLASPVSNDVYYGVFDNGSGSIWRSSDGVHEQLKAVQYLGEFYDISPDGRWLVYYDRNGNDGLLVNSVLGVLDLENPANPHQALLPIGHFLGGRQMATFSPDGTKLALLKGGFGRDGLDVFTLDRSDPDALTVTGEVINIPQSWNGDEATAVAWRQDGVVRFDAERLPGAGVSEITFTNTSIAGDGSGDPLIPISWDFGDGSDLRESQAPQVIHTYAEQDTYSVTLTVLDQEGTPQSATQEVVVAPPSLVMGLTWDEDIELDGRLPESTTFPATLTVRATSQGLGSIDDITFENDELARFSPLGILSITSEFDTATGFSLQPGERRDIPVELTTTGLGRVTIRSAVAGTSTDGTAVDTTLEKNERVGSDLSIQVSAEVRSDEEGEEDSFVAFPEEGIELEFDEAEGLPKPRDVKLTLEIKNVSGDIADEAMLDVSTLVQTLEDRDPNAPDTMDIFGYVVGEEDPVVVDPAVAKVDEIPLGRIEVDATLTVVVEAKAQNKGIVEAKGLVLATGPSADEPHEPTRTLSGSGATLLRIDQPVLLVVDGDPTRPALLACNGQVPSPGSLWGW